jgi:glycerophosphoryl diester phosphodiesterase
MEAVPTIVAHRGLHHALPENSLEAFRAAVRAGIEWVEFDVQSSREGFPVILHDDTLDAMTMSSGPVAARRVDDLRRVRLRFNGRPSEAFVPVLRMVPGGAPIHALGASLMVEIKPQDDSRLVQRLAQVLRGYPRPWVIQSFDRRNLEHSESFAPHVPRYLLIDDHSELRAAIADSSYSLNAHHELVTPALVETLHRLDRTIGAWTVNGESNIQRMLDLGVDIIITDEPVLAMEMMSRRFLPAYHSPS